MDPWQQLVVDGVLSERDDGRFAAFTSSLICPRQQGKGTILEVLELAHAVLFESETILHTAHLDRTAKNHFNRMVKLFEGTPELKRKVKAIRYSNGDRGILLKNGCSISFSTRAKEGGRGLSGDLVVIDEAMRLKGLGDLMPTLAARPNPQIYFFSSAPLIGPESDVLRGICGRGRKGAPRSFYAEWSSPHDVDPDDRDAWWASNPAMGTRLSIEMTETERASMSDDEFRRERLGAWNPDEAIPSFIPGANWSACADPAANPVDPLTYGIDLTLDRQHATIAAAGTWDGHNTVVAMDHYDGPDAPAWMVARLIELSAHPYKQVTLDEKSPANTEVDKLVAAGVNVVPLKFGDLVKACAGFFDEVMAGTLRHNGDPVLTAAVAGSQKRDAAGSWLWDRKPGAVITPLSAATWARYGHLTAPDTPAPVAIGAIYR